MTSEDYFIWRADIKSAYEKGGGIVHITRIIEQQLRELELDFYSLFIRHPVPFTRPKTFLYSNYPEDWLEHYFREDFYQLDPVLKMCGSPGKIWLWDDEAISSGVRVFENARNYGIFHGLSCSVMASNRSVGIFSMSTANSLKTIELTPVMELKIQYISELSMASLIKINDISMATTKLDLSQRELEILKWTAEGKTSAEISLILSISENTVNFHQKKMQKRFNAPNKTQIASYAAAIGLI
ncbi:transcriptional regulator SdiA [Erwinia pyrifoliae]|uniref:Transcriptional regulator SdiA n=1 Tax=Erwinia pyrifoliae TaxID=79967 RepID=A0ABY5X436_ERWPY|nr:transcriptional regulator SdiA [Erwinia pyrifoliae]AUX72334.1 transcriptional regulator SdiA [Erwinia pyrifoliae]MCA8877422.1 transcriptional regulator SdiA [Erwinia pyrifoliae]MCT2388586.1 transcriptional regulator SdiA [Erwinia pyrifoliae]MCU8586755.1 transcriptional regulator SdiA [Erwinia pyrifoliae]UWS32143.1 transcriptional regulator SdiA [Erwinia pyrifoliae]